MKFSPYFVTLVALCFSTSYLKASCAPLEKARTTFLDGREEEGIVTARCHSDLGNTDATILYSDLQWWAGHTVGSQEAAKKALTQTDKLDFLSEVRLTNRARLWLLKEKTDVVSNSLYDGFEQWFSAQYRYYAKNSLELEYRHIKRNYIGDLGLTDDSLELRHTLVLGRKAYLDAGALLSFNSLLLPQYAFKAIPHYSLPDESDVGLEFRYSRYKTFGTSAILVAPSWSKPILELGGVEARVYFTFFNSNTYLSYLASLYYRVLPRMTLKANFSFGKSIEDATLIDTYRNYNFSIRYYLISYLAVIPEVELYRGNFRTENRFGLKLEIAL